MTPVEVASSVVTALDTVEALRVEASDLMPGDVVVEPVFTGTDCTGHRVAYVMGVVAGLSGGEHTTYVTTADRPDEHDPDRMRCVVVSPRYRYPRTGSVA